jgi:hypothetical protein
MPHPPVQAGGSRRWLVIAPHEPSDPTFLTLDPNNEPTHSWQVSVRASSGRDFSTDGGATPLMLAQLVFSLAWGDHAMIAVARAQLRSRGVILLTGAVRIGRLATSCSSIMVVRRAHMDPLPGHLLPYARQPASRGSARDTCACVFSNPDARPTIGTRCAPPELLVQGWPLSK